MKNRTVLILAAVLTLSLLGNIVFWGWYASTPVTAGGAIGTVSISDLKFSAMVIKYVQLDDKGTMGYTARIDYDVLDMNGNQIKSVSKNIVLNPTEVTWLSTFVNSKTTAAKSGANILTSDTVTQ